MRNKKLNKTAIDFCWSGAAGPFYIIIEFLSSRTDYYLFYSISELLFYFIKHSASAQNAVIIWFDAIAIEHNGINGGAAGLLVLHTVSCIQF